MHREKKTIFGEKKRVSIYSRARLVRCPQSIFEERSITSLLVLKHALQKLIEQSAGQTRTSFLMGDHVHYVCRDFTKGHYVR